MIEAVLFDWGNTLMRFTWSDELLAAGHRAGLAALGRELEAPAFTRRYQAELEPRLREPDAPERLDYGAELQALLDGASPDEVAAFRSAEHDAWAPAHELASTTHALLEALRTRGLRLGVVANAWPEPAELLRRDLERLGVAERVDAVVFAAEAGERKPHPAPFRRALAELDVRPEAALFVGDSLEADIRGARSVGMRTVQALWFRADEEAEGIEADFQAFTQMDVLSIAGRLSGTA